MTFAALIRQECGWFDNVENSSAALSARLTGDTASLQNVCFISIILNLIEFWIPYGFVVHRFPAQFGAANSFHIGIRNIYGISDLLEAFFDWLICIPLFIVHCDHRIQVKSQQCRNQRIF